MEEEKIELEIPENFRNVINDLTNDLSITYPEYSYLWVKWGSSDLKEDELKELFQYSTTVYPERFFDILYQNEEIFKFDNTTNVYFLPNVDFRLLFNCDNVTENTRKTIWKYLQLILFMVVNSIKNKSPFGDTKDLFDGVDEKELQEKLEETMKGITSFFSNFDNKKENQEEKEGESTPDLNPNDFLKQTEDMFENMKGMPGMPNMDSFKKSFNPENAGKGMPKPEDLHEHLKGLFDGKIGKLAKEMAEEISEDMSNLFGEEKNNIKSSEDVLKNLMKNPKKIMDLVKIIGNKLKTKMASGDISQEDIMKEASEIISKMKGKGGGGEDNDMLKNLLNQMKDMKGLSGLSGLAGLSGLSGLGGGKNVRIDKGKLNNMIKQQTFKEKMKERYEKKKLVSMIETSILTEKKNGFIEKLNDENFVFKIENDKQEKSFIKQNEEKNIDNIMNELKLTNDCIVTPQNSKKSTGNPSDKKGKKKGKK